MKRKRLIWQLFPVYLGITWFSLIAIGILATKSVRDFYYDENAKELESIARLVKLQILDGDTVQTPDTMDSICVHLGRLTSTRVTLIRTDGIVLGDTDENPGVMENHADRPEFREAISGSQGLSIRYSPTLQDMRMYLALPIPSGSEIPIVVRVSRSVLSINSTLNQVYTWIIVGGLIIAILASVVSYIMAKKISRPLEEMRRGAQSFARGDFSHKIAIPSAVELGQLGDALNNMAEELKERISTITQQRNELEAILSSMVEGVLAIDKDERILSLNSAAGVLLDIEVAEAKGRNIQEATLNPEFQNFVRKVMDSSESVESEVVFHRDKKYFLQIHGTHLRNERGEEIGVLVVLNDVTRLRQLENLRREFVANVSHELRTPITSIKGFVETLQDGAIQNPEDTERFLEIISQHADRLNAIIEDLLSLSKIEREAEFDEIPLEQSDVVGVLNRAAQNCESRAKAKQISIEVRPSDSVMAMINPRLLEQAIVNLLDNAISYSEEGSTVMVGLDEHRDEIVVLIQDNGCGIASEHLPRIFERFYRVDKDRSRKLGGTGLGLAIVKHIALSHRAKVSVDSTPGKGSVFRIHLPRI